MVSQAALGWFWKCPSLVIDWKVAICVEPRAWNLPSFARPALVISLWLQMKIDEVGWGGKCWLPSGVLLNRNFRSIDSLFFLGARNLMMAYLWCLQVVMFFPTRRCFLHPTLLLCFDWQLLRASYKSPGFWGSSGASNPTSFIISLPAGPQNIRRACANSLLWKVKSTDKCQLWTPVGFLVLEKGKEPAQKGGESVGCCARVQPVGAASCSQKGLVLWSWCKRAAPGPVLLLEAAQTWCILLCFFALALQLSGWPTQQSIKVVAFE